MNTSFDSAGQDPQRDRNSATASAPAGLVLAAGGGRRLGRGPKALLHIGGRTLVEAMVEALLSGGCADVTVVTGAGAAAVADVLPHRRNIVMAHNAQWSTGMGSSLRRGLRAIGEDRDVLVTPVDRPGISSDVVRRVIASHVPGGITAAAHRSADGDLVRGHPVLFDARWTVAAAASAHGDAGARQLLAERRELVRLVDCSDIDDGADIDVPADLLRYTR